MIPDIRDRYPRVAGSHGGDGTMLGDAIRDAQGSWEGTVCRGYEGTSGIVYRRIHGGIADGNYHPRVSNYLQLSRSVPTSNEVRPITFMTNCYIKAGTTAYRKQLRASMVDLFLPVGSIWTTTIDPLQSEGKICDPNELFQHGTWEIWQEAAGAVLVNIDRNDPEIAYTKMQAGKKLHQLSVRELPSHSHGIAYPEMQWPAIAKNQALSGYEVQGTQLTGSTTEPCGESVPFSLMQKSISVVYWLRTS